MVFLLCDKIFFMKDEESRRPKITSSIYCLSDDRILLMKRRNHPFRGLWIPPGGKIEKGEHPRQAAIRELKEETGLIPTRLILRGIVREYSENPEWQWLIFYYVTDAFEGKLVDNSEEGDLVWWRIDEVANLPIPDADRILMYSILDLKSDIYEGLFIYDLEERLTGFNDRI
jgi:8-oxo-dGTP diphosphatase